MPKKKTTYVLDTNILMQSPYAIFSFDEHDVCITDITVEELDRHKRDHGETGANIREVIRILEELMQSATTDGSLVKGIALPGGEGTFRIELESNNNTEAINDCLPQGWNPAVADNRILGMCKVMNKRLKNVILVTNDFNMRIKANLIGIEAEEYRTDRIRPAEGLYTGRSERLTKPGAISLFYQLGKLSPEDLYLPSDAKQDPSELVRNEFVLLIDAADPKCTALGRFDGTDIVALQYADQTPYGITPRNAGQRFLQEALLAPVEEIPLVVVRGIAGSAKTFYSLACGLEKVVEQKEYRKILLSRPNVKFDEDIGYLKGSEQDKIAPLIRPFMDNLELLCQTHNADSYAFDLFDYGYIEAQAMAYMRGRSITNTWIILDEFQNASPLQAFGMVSRAGTGSKVILLGDPSQIDNPRLNSLTNGLVYTGEKMKGHNLCAVLALEESECQRSLLAKAAIDRMSPKGYADALVERNRSR